MSFKVGVNPHASRGAVRRSWSRQSGDSAVARRDHRVVVRLDGLIESPPRGRLLIEGERLDARDLAIDVRPEQCRPKTTWTREEPVGQSAAGDRRTLMFSGECRVDSRSRRAQVDRLRIGNGVESRATQRDRTMIGPVGSDRR